MGRAKRKFRHAPQNTQGIFAAVAGSIGHQPAGNIPQTVAEPPAQTLEPYNKKKEEVERETIRRARSLFKELTSQAGEGKLVPEAGYSHLEEYEELDSCFEGLAQLGTNCMKDMKGEYMATKAAWEDNKESPTLCAELFLHEIRLTLSIQLEFADVYLCMTQLFNAPKMFCWAKSGYNQVQIDRAARHGIKLKAGVTGALEQIKDDPVEEPAGNTKKNKKKKGSRKPNLDHFTALLAEYVPNLTKLLEGAQAVNNSIDNEDIGAPRFPELNTILAHGVVADVPEHVIQSISDIVFLLDEMHATRPDVAAQRDTVLQSLKAWRAIDKDFWEYAKENLYQNPIVAKYDYSRRSFLALFTLWRREETKAFDYVDEHGLTEKLESGLRQRLGWLPHRKDREEDEKGWQSQVEQLKKALPSAEELLSEYEETLARSTVGTQARTTGQLGGWWKVLLS